MADLKRLFRDSVCRVPMYTVLAASTVEVRGEKLTLTMWTKNGPGHTSFRAQVHDASGAELYDGDDSYDTGNALHNANNWLAQYERMRNPNYTPTVAEALADPAGFVAGMTEIGGEA